MSITPLNIGSAPNDGNGQSLRSGGAVINANFAELDVRVSAAQTKADASQPKEDGKGLSANDFTTVEKNKLGGIATGATANATDAQLRDRSTHTGTQLAATISNFAATALSVALAGLSVATGTAVIATDSILVAIGKLQSQVTARAMKGANSDITALSGLTTALSIAQGGTGGNSQVTAQASLGLVPVSSASDTTAGRLTTVGWMGLGSIATPYTADLNALTGSRLLTYGSGQTANMIAGMDYGEGIFLNGPSGTDGAMLLLNHDSDRAFMKRKRANVYSPGFEFHTTANSTLDPALGTGGIVSSGSNANGSFTKFADGTMICTGTGAVQTTGSQIGTTGIFFSATNPYATFPVAFVGANPRVTYSAIEQTVAFSWVAGDAGAGLTSCTSRLMSVSATATARVTYVAIGRWKA